MYRILIVEDDTALSQELCATLTRYQYDVLVATNWSDISGECARVQPHLVIMDVNLPILDGFAWCKRIRQFSSVPVLFLSARGAPSDMIHALEGGGDDYLTKPVVPQLLLSKIAAILRRTYEFEPAPPVLLSHGGVTLDIPAACAIIGDVRLDLSRNELKLLIKLMEHRGQYVTRVQLMQLLWDDDVYVNENSLTVSVNRLRRRLADVGLPDFISTRKGVGYGILE